VFWLFPAIQSAKWSFAWHEFCDDVGLLTLRYSDINPFYLGIVELVGHNYLTKQRWKIVYFFFLVSLWVEISYSKHRLNWIWLGWHACCFSWHFTQLRLSAFFFLGSLRYRKIIVLCLMFQDELFLLETISECHWVCQWQLWLTVLTTTLWLGKNLYIVAVKEIKGCPNTQKRQKLARKNQWATILLPRYVLLKSIPRNNQIQCHFLLFSSVQPSWPSLL